MLTGKGLRPLPPSTRASTKVAMAVVAGVVLAGLASAWFPYPAGWIALGVAVYVAIPLLVMVALDRSRLRQQKLQLRNLEVFPPQTAHDVGWVNIDRQPLAEAYLLRWRRWLAWLAGSFVLSAVLAIFVPWGLAIVPAAIGVAGEYFLLVNVVEWLVPASWARLRPWERWRLRAGLLAVGLVYASIALAILGFIVYGFFFSARPVRWNNFAFAFFYGLFALVCAWRSYECFGRFRREVPANEERSTRPL